MTDPRPLNKPPWFSGDSNVGFPNPSLTLKDYTTLAENIAKTKEEDEDNETFAMALAI